MQYRLQHKLFKSIAFEESLLFESIIPKLKARLENRNKKNNSHNNTDL